jgi:myo-inositol 2-dehydrogenase/D-chiro-inositol 1-dehydrogenase
MSIGESGLRYGLFGIGRCGCVHGQILLGQGQHIVALGDESSEAINAAAQKLDLLKASRFTAPDAMARHGEIDAVVISSHTRDHAHHALPFIQAGIPVYLEKPLTAELAEAFSFVDITGPSRNLLQIGLQRRFDPALVYAKQLLDQKLIGEIREIRSVLRDQYPPPPTYSSRGLIIDMGIHVADEAHWLTGEFPCRVWAKMFHAKEYRSPIDEGGNTAHVGFLTPGGIIGRLDLSRTHASGYNNETSIIGTRGVLQVGRFSGYPGPIHVELWTSNGQLHPASKTFQMTELPSGHAEFQPRFQTAYQNAHAQFRQSIAHRADFLVTQNEVLDAQVIVEAAHRSALQGGVERPLARSANLTHYAKLCREAELL